MVMGQCCRQTRQPQQPQFNNPVAAATPTSPTVFGMASYPPPQQDMQQIEMQSYPPPAQQDQYPPAQQQQQDMQQIQMQSYPPPAQQDQYPPAQQQQQQPSTFCSSCGTQTGPGVPFCQSCGAPQ